MKIRGRLAPCPPRRRTSWRRCSAAAAWSPSRRSTPSLSPARRCVISLSGFHRLFVHQLLRNSCILRLVRACCRARQPDFGQQFLSANPDGLYYRHLQAAEAELAEDKAKRTAVEEEAAALAAGVTDAVAASDEKTARLEVWFLDVLLLCSRCRMPGLMAEC